MSVPAAESAPLFLCANSRLARHLRLTPPRGGEGVWPACRALTVTQWLDNLLEEAMLCGQAPPAILLDASAERLLWEQVIADTLAADAAPLFDLRGLAASAMEANQLCEHWQLRLSGLPAAEETRQFLAWQKEFFRRTTRRNWLETPRQQTLAIELLARGRITAPPAVVFAGFDRLTPLELRLRQALESHGTTISEWTPPDASAAPPTVLACADSTAECRAIGRWAEAHLIANPQCRLGIIVPDLASVRDRLEFALDDRLHPEAGHAENAEMPRIYNFSLGRPLAAHPLICVALDLLALSAARSVEQTSLSALLCAPGWSADVREADDRARLDATMRRELGTHLELAELLRLARRLHARATIHCPALLRHMGDFVTAASTAGTRRRLPSAWARHFAEWLELLGWPGERPLSSHEFQTRGAFVESLDHLAGHDEILGPVSLPEALRRLRDLCRDQVFQPETAGQPAVQVLGVLESAGLDFDAVWIMGMNAHRWPTPPRPNPLLPAELQRHAGTPHASAEAELVFARHVHARLCRAAPEIHFSYARQDGTRPLQISPLLADLPEDDDCPPVTPAEEIALESLDDWQAPPVTEGEKVAGGTALLRAQAICPAWGYFRYRLGAEALKTPVEGLDAMQRGILVHATLEKFWTVTPGLTALHAMSGEKLETAIAAAVESALAAFEADHEHRLTPRTRRLEAARLIRLLDDWLAFEAARPEDFTVAACEQVCELEIDGLRIRTVIDRIDRLSDDRLLVIDYKTGQRIDTRNWAAERITEPQLPIYAALAAPGNTDNRIAGVAFARVRFKDAAFAGIAENAGLLPGVAGFDETRRSVFGAERFPDWAALITHWQASLLAIAGEVKAGDAGIRFAEENDLAYCEVLPLLRLPERRRQLALAGGEA